MTPAQLEAYLRQHIPLSKAMDVKVMKADVEEVVLSAPLLPNINHRETIFGGSASAVAILAAWSLLHLKLVGAGIESRIVIQRNTMEYLAPIDGGFIARSAFDPSANWDLFVRMLSRKGRARLSVNAVLEYQGTQAGRFVGEFVAFGGDWK